jgi:hypothetical protein
MAKVSGRFYFRRTINGNLLGEFSNDHTKRNFTESADIDKSENKDGFEGEYNTSWYEGEPFSAKLKIKKEGELYFLEWTDPAAFTGEGMLCEKDLLVGNYWSS